MKKYVAISMKTVKLFVLYFVAIVSSMGYAFGADINLAETGRPPHRPMNGILIEGQIVKGDFQRFQALALLWNTGTVWLASPGGDLAEAIKIGQLVRTLKLAVWAPDKNEQFQARYINVKDPRNNVCASACFFIYAAGIERMGDVLGVHRPRMSADDLRKISMEQAANGQGTVAEVSTKYLKSMGIGNSVIEKMLSTRPEDISWLNESEVKALEGYIPEYQDWLEAKCPLTMQLPSDSKPCENCTADAKISRYLARQSQARFDCKKELVTDARENTRSDLKFQYAKSGQLTEHIEQQRISCAKPSERHRRDCPK